MNMILNLDLETRSACDLPTCGGYKYSHDPSTHILCYSYKLDGQIVMSVTGETVHPDVRAAIQSGATVRAWNGVGFDREVWNARFPDCQISLAQTDDTMDRARACGLPGSLDLAARFLGLNQRKDFKGHRLMLKLCNATTPTPTDDELRRLSAYCSQDVVTESNLVGFIPPLNETEEKIRQLSHQINERGIYVDVDLAQRAVQFADVEHAELSLRLKRLTGGNVERHTQRNQLLKFLQGRGVNIQDLQKATLEALTDSDVPDEVAREVIDIRLSGAKASTAKFKAALNMVMDDGRVRGTFVYFGAQATGRFTSRALQVHNMPRDSSTDVEASLMSLEERTCKSVYKTLSTLLRPMITAPAGRTLVRCDYSAIEGRVMAWLCGDVETLREYRGRGRIYERAATAIFPGYSVDQVSKAQRQVGKVAELACQYGGGWRAFMAMGRAYGIETVKPEAEAIVRAWRRAHPEVCAFWEQTETCAIRAYRNKGSLFFCADKKVSMVVDPATESLWIRLPAGRFICLPKFDVTYEEGPYGMDAKLSYQRGNWSPAKGSDVWPRAYTWGGSIVESLCQGIARDLLCDAMLQLQHLDIVMHVHDEIVIECAECDADDVLRQMTDVMSTAPAWAGGLPLNAVGVIDKRFGK